MATLRDIRRRISGVRKTQKITKAMKMVAAAKLRRAQANVVAARPYARRLNELLQQLSASTDVNEHPLAAPRETQVVALVIVTSDRGLCGAFNANLVRIALQHMNNQYPRAREEGRLKLFCIGKKGFDVFSKRNFKVVGKYIGVYNNLVFGQAQNIMREIIAGYLKREFDKVEVMYNEFKSIGQQRLVVNQLLPLAVEQNQKQVPPADYICEPTAREILSALLPRHLDFQMWKVLLESNAAEQGSRMAAMESATENANEMISVLQLSYNKARQAAITKELLEVVSGAEALRQTG